MGERLNCMSGVHDALNRLKRAHDRKTGCHLTADMVQSLGLSFLAETWGEPDPRDPHPNKDTAHAE